MNVYRSIVVESLRGQVCLFVPVSYASSSSRSVTTEVISSPFLDIHLHDFAAVDLPRKTYVSTDNMHLFSRDR